MLSRFEQFSFVISSINRYIQKIERDEMVKHGYRGAFAQYLAALNHFEEGLTSAQLCSVCNKDKAAVSRIVAEMEEKGLVAREQKNKYRAKILLTEKGKETADFVADRALAAVTAVDNNLFSDEERDLFYNFLDSICIKLQKISREGVPQE